MTLVKLIESFKDLRVVVVGDPILDHYIAGSTTRVSPEAPVPVVQVERDYDVAGGAANVAVNVAQLGAQVRLVATIGSDDPGDRMITLLRKAGVMTDHLLPLAGKTIIKARVLSQGHQICRIDWEEPPEARVVNLDVYGRKLESALSNAHVCIVSDYGKGAVSSGMMSVLKSLRCRGQLLAFDPHPGHDVDFTEVDLLTPNRQEAEIMAAHSWDRAGGIEGLMNKIYNLHLPRNLAITLGPDGIAVGQKEGYIDTLPAIAQEVFDVSGAGDTVIAVMALALRNGAPLQTAAALANLAAGRVIGKVGTCPITADELKQAVFRSMWDDHEFEAI
jgi:rfaE bifunctional protein kinase chain/domain